MKNVCYESFFSDGRVSDGTTNLIRNLLVLQPSRRLTAVQVLDSLSSIIATFKVPTMIGEEEQVVPDISVIGEENSEKKVDNVETNTRPKPLSDFYKHVILQVSLEKKREKIVTREVISWKS